MDRAPNNHELCGPPYCNRRPLSIFKEPMQRNLHCPSQPFQGTD